MNRPDLIDLLGHRVTVTNRNGSSTWTGKLIALSNEPCAVIDQDRGPRLCLPQSFTITPASELKPGHPVDPETGPRWHPWPFGGLPQRDHQPGLASGYLVGARVHGQPDDLVAKLDGMLANLQAHIDRRAQELAQPLIAKAREAAATDVERAQHEQQRAEDLVTELRRHVRALEQRRDEQRQRAERAEAAVERMRTLIDSYPPGSDFVQCGAAQLFRDHLDGTKGQKETGRG